MDSVVIKAATTVEEKVAAKEDVVDSVVAAATTVGEKVAAEVATAEVSEAATLEAESRATRWQASVHTT